MKFQVDSGKLLYALGVVFAAAALLYFVRDVVFDRSITVKAALLFLAFGAGVSLQRDLRASIPVDVNSTEAVTDTVERGQDCTVERDTPTPVVAVGPRFD